MFLQIIGNFGGVSTHYFVMNKRFWIKNIIILEDRIIYSKNEEVAEKLNNVFIDAV